MGREPLVVLVRGTTAAAGLFALDEHAAAPALPGAEDDDDNQDNEAWKEIF